MKAADDLVNTGINAQRHDVRLNRTKEVVAQANSIILVESEAFEQILPSTLKKPNVH